MLINEIVEDEGALWTEGSISWISNNRGSYHGKKVQIVDGSFYPCVSVLSGEAYCWVGSRSVLSICLNFCVF